MTKKPHGSRRRPESLSRERIIEASIELLDASGEAGLTFQALSRRLATGPGAIYWHIASKSDLLTAACDAIVARTMDAASAGGPPQATLRAVALGLFDMIDAHPWVGAALGRGAVQMPMLRIIEPVGRQLRALGVAEDAAWTTVSALLHYILGVAGQNAANARFAQAHALDRSDFLEGMAGAWSELDPASYPFVRSIVGQFRDHDDRADFLAGIDLILAGIGASRLR